MRNFKFAVSSSFMQFRRFIRLLVLLALPLLITVSSCREGQVCAGLNNRTGSANSARNARKSNRGGYKSQREVEARSRQRKRLKKRGAQSNRKSRGGGNTTGGHRHFGENADTLQYADFQ
jgi:hypothetical protein